MYQATNSPYTKNGHGSLSCFWYSSQMLDSCESKWRSWFLFLFMQFMLIYLYIRGSMAKTVVDLNVHPAAQFRQRPVDGMQLARGRSASTRYRPASVPITYHPCLQNVGFTGVTVFTVFTDEPTLLSSVIM